MNTPLSTNQRNDFASMYMPELISHNTFNNTIPPSEYQFRSLNTKLQTQNRSLLEISINHYNQTEELQKALEKEMEVLTSNLKKIKNISIHNNNDNPIINGLEHKISEFKRLIESNNIQIKKNNESLPEIQRKKKENEDFFKKFHGEKKVWLDRLIETKLRDDAYLKGFKYFYEAKTMKLILEGILLEKVQDKVEKELMKRGEAFGWDVMDEARMNEERKQEEHDLNTKLLEINDNDKIIQLEKEAKRKWEKEDKDNEQKRERYSALWKQLWQEIWIPSCPLSNDESLVQQRELVKRVTMDVTFEMFKQLCFDVWKFKNIINSAEEYVVLDKVRRYFPDDPTKTNKDEASLDKMMDIIDNIKQEQELIYCDLKYARNTVREYERSTGPDKAKISSSIERLNKIIDKIQHIQDTLKATPDALLKKEVEEIRMLIKAIPDDKERKLFTDNLYDSQRLYDQYLPLTTLLMVVSFISIGNKRTKGYNDKIDTIMKTNEEMKLQNKEYEGKLEVLNEIKAKMADDEMKELINNNNNNIGEAPTPGNNVELCNKAKEQLITHYNYLKGSQKNIFNLRDQFFKGISNSVVQPYTINDNEDNVLLLNQIQMQPK